MPVVRLYYDDLEQMVGASRETIMEKIPMIGADLGRPQDEYVDVEFFPDRPDLYSAEGVARAMRGFLGIEKGLVEYPVHPGDVTLTVEESVKSVRPIIGCAVVRGLKFTDPAIESLMALQEDLHWGLGRNRRKVAIGVHDISRVVPPFRYIGSDPSFEFIPLGFMETMSMREILKRHPKGVDYAHILDGFESYPLILDANEDVLSFPPIINGQLTSVDESTSDLFIDVTGTDPIVFKALNIVVTSLAERGGRVEAVNVKSSLSDFVSPDLTPSHRIVNVDEANRLIGTKIDVNEMASCLEKMRFGTRVIDSSQIEVAVPAYRSDIMHSWDIFEDMAKGFGFDKLDAKMPVTSTIGQPHPVQVRRNEAREVMVGLGYLETMPFTLTSERMHFDMMNRQDEKVSNISRYTRVMHPISELHTMVRTTIMPSLLEILSFNQHHPLPQRIFAVGDVVVGGQTKTSLAAVSIHSNARFAEIRSVVSSLLSDLRIAANIEESKDGAFLPGRGADLILDGKKVGRFGEVHPTVIRAFGLGQPVVAFEIEP